MKRTLVLVITISAIVTVTTQASNCHYNNRYRVRWSPYTHGLVYGDIKYSPYAYKRGGSGMVYNRLRYSPYAKGLVYYNVRYSPYAFGYKKSGLIADPWGKSYDYYYARPYRSTGPCTVVYQSSSQSLSPSVKRGPNIYQNAKNNYLANKAVRKARTENLKQYQKSHQVKQRELNGKDLITAYLNLNKINFRTSRILSIEHKLISIDFILTDQNIIIKYWNPEEILALKRQKNSRIFYYENYLESYKEYCSEYLNNGGKIYQVITADNREILAKLLEYDELKTKRKSSDTTVVAKADEESAVLETSN